MHQAEIIPRESHATRVKAAPFQPGRSRYWASCRWNLDHGARIYGRTGKQLARPGCEDPFLEVWLRPPQQIGRFSIGIKPGGGGLAGEPNFEEKGRAKYLASSSIF